MAVFERGNVIGAESKRVKQATFRRHRGFSLHTRFRKEQFEQKPAWKTRAKNLFAFIHQRNELAHVSWMRKGN